MDDDNPAAASMKMMTLFAPLMSVFIAFSVPTGLGVYWIATAVFQTVLQLIVNRHYDKIGVDAIIAKSVEKANKKRAKKGLPPQQIAKNATDIAALQGLVGDGYEAIPSASIKGLFSA